MTKKIILILLIFFPVKSIFSQEPVPDIKLSLQLKNTELKDILDTISAGTGLFFAYNPNLIDDRQKLSVNFQNQTLAQILEQLGKQAGFSFKITGKQIILKPAPKPKKQITIAGYAADSQSKELLLGAQIFIDGKLTTFTNQYGYFAFQAPQGTHILKVSYIAHQDFIQKISTTTDTIITALLQPAVNQLQGVTVTPETQNKPLENNQLEKISFNKTQILSSAGLAGSNDLMKSLGSIPGFSFYGDGSVIFHVRGGDKSQNLILIDDAPIFNVSHLLGFFSVISPWAVNSINVYKNDLPVEYWGRNSSVIDIRIRQGDLQKTGIAASYSPFLTSFTVDGPVVKGKSSFLLSVRKSNLQWLNRLQPELMQVKFYDFHLKMSRKINRKNRFYISLYTGNDKVTTPADYYANSMWWGNSAASARWNHLLGTNSFVNTIIYTGRYSYYLSFDVDTSNLFNSMLYQSGIKSTLYWYKQNNLTLKAGYGLSHFFFNPANINKIAYIPTSNAFETALFAAGEYSYKNTVKIKAALNLHNWINAGPTIVYTYTNYIMTQADTIGFKAYNYIIKPEPRLSISYAVNQKNIFKLSAGYYTQYQQLVTNSISPFTTAEAWIGADNNIPPQETWQISAGYSKGLAENTQLTIEFYAKNTKNIVFLIDHSSLLFNSTVISNIRNGELKAFGAELNIVKNSGKLTYNIAVTASKTTEKIPYLLQNSWFYAPHDKPLIVNFSLNYNTKKISAGLNWNYSSGIRYTAPAGYYTFLERKIPYYTTPYNAQMPDYHRLDINIKYLLNKRKNSKFNHWITFSLYNVYGRKNPVLVNFNKIQDSQGRFYVPANYIYQYQLTPAYYYLLRYVPCLTYNFTWR